MTAVNTYEIHMKLNNRMTQLPDSQKIFGALIYLYARYTTDEKASQLVSGIKNNEIYCGVSNMMPVGYFPSPLPYFLEQTSFSEGTKKSGNKTKENYKCVKQKEYIKQEELLMVLNEEKKLKQCSYVYMQESQQIHASIDSLHYQMPGLSPNLYSVPEAVAIEVVENQERILTDFKFYLSIDQGMWEEEFMQALIEAKETGKTFFLGPRASQGLNIYTMKEILSVMKHTDYENAECFLNLGMLLPDKVNMKKSYMSYFTSERRPYNKTGGWDKKQANQFISYIKAGSILYLDGSHRQVGKCISAGYDEHSIIFGNAMMYPITKLKKWEM